MKDDVSRRPMSLWSMSLAGIRYGWRVSFSVALGVATATAVIVGALLVGDSMRGSLRELTVERLGRIDSLVMPMNFFEAEGISDDAVPVIFFTSGIVEAKAAGNFEDPVKWFENADGNGDSLLNRAELQQVFEADRRDLADWLLEDYDDDDDGELTLEEFLRADGAIRRAGSIQIIGCDERFWDLGVTDVRPSRLPGDNGVIMNQSAADELGVKVGDQVTVRLPVEQAVPADSPLGRRDVQTEGLPRMEVIDVVPDRGLGRFAITPSQAAPQNVYLSLETVADVLDRQGQANLLLFDQPTEIDDLQVGLDDLGMNLERVRQTFDSGDGDADVIYDYFSLTSDQLLLPEPAVERITEVLGDDAVMPVMTYLANAIERLDDSGEVAASVPYSTITAIESSSSLPLDFTGSDVDGQASDRVPLVINSWTASRLDAQPGTPLRVAYFEPEVEEGREVERFFDAVVTDIVPITEPATPYRRRADATFSEPPTVYNDPQLTPTVPGVTDQASINDWDLPFPLERDITNEDDEYWGQYRLTPKAFLPLEEGRRLFGSRFGQTTSLRISVEAFANEEALRTRLVETLQPMLADLGWAVRPIRQQQLAASRGTTPFDYLFLALSFFVILAAVMLIIMLFRLGLVQRLPQFGTLLAVGWPPGRVAALARNEGFVVAALGVLIGLAGGALYAAAVLRALRSYWVGAVTVPFLTFHWTWPSVLIGAAAGWLVAAAALVFTSRALMRIEVQSLLTGRDSDAQPDRTQAGKERRRRSNGKSAWLIGSLVVVAVLIAGLGANAGGQAAAGGFVGGGMMLLAAGLTTIFVRLRRPRRLGEPADTTSKQGSPAVQSLTLGGLASRNASRHPLRSTLTIGLMAAASFLIIAISAFRLEPTEQGTGGFDLIARSAQPLYRDLSQPDVQSSMLGPDAERLASSLIVPMRLRQGQDASCNNLYQASQPTVLGVPKSVDRAMAGDAAELPGFQWWATAELAEGSSPWSLLEPTAAGTEEDPVPVILDQNTALYSLQMRGGIGEVTSFEYEAGQPIHFRVVGLLSNSLLQGKLLIGNENFETVFDEISGYQYFLVACDDGQRDAIARTLENRLGDVGMDVSDASVVLSGLLAVQNTYLRTFQSLGALGLLLGTIGLAVAQLRSVLERRQELAVLRAMGFTRKRLAAMVMSETAALLLAGIGCGVVCAVLAVVPHAVLSGLRPPLIEPLIIVSGIILFGMLAGIIAVGRVVRMPLMESLRSE